MDPKKTYKKPLYSFAWYKIAVLVISVALCLCKTIVKHLYLFSDAQTWRIPRIFSWLQQEGHLSEEEMARTFNCGIGAALVVSKDLTEQILRDIQQHKEEAWVIGRVVACPEGNCSLFSCS